MSWLSKAVHAVNQISDPVGNVIRDKVTPQYKDIAMGGSNTAGAPAANDPAAAPIDPSQGNASDPAYGSFTQPFDVQSFYQNLDPSYFFRLQQGQQGLQNSAAAGSGALSGSALKDLMNYNQTAASQEYGNAYNRYQTTQGNIFNRLYSIAGLGQASAGNVAANNTNLAGNAGQALQNAGTASGAGIVGAGNAVSGALGTYGAYNYMNQNPAARVSP
jgi:hypothetical protein